MANDVDRVSWTAHPKSIFLWPLVLAGYLFWFPANWGWNAGGLGWAYILIAFFVILAVAVDLSRNYAIFAGVALALIIVGGWWLRDVKGITVLGDIYRAFARLNVRYDPPLGLALSILLSIVVVVGLAWAWGNNRYTMTHNEIVHHVFGRGDMSIGRGARVFRTNYPDVFERILCFAGTISIYDNTGRAQILRTEHVPFLSRKAKKMDKILETLQVTTDDTVTAPDTADHDGADDLH